jgi:hypothetical protein
MCACLHSSGSCFGTHLAQILWYLRSSWMMEYADLQLLSNLWAISVTVICLSSWTTATCSTLSAVYGQMAWPVSSVKPVLPLWNFSTNWYTFLSVIVFSISSEHFSVNLKTVLPPPTTKMEWQHITQPWWNPKEEPTCLHCNCTGFTEHDGHPTTCLDLAQYAVCMMSARAVKLPGF